MWICLFTCLVTRAVHIDVVTDMSSETFIRCLKRFAARRGIPQKFLSDNGRQLHVLSRQCSRNNLCKTICLEEVWNGFLILKRLHGGEEYLRD